MGTLHTNIPGQYHIDARCIDCAICTEIAPRNFCSDHEQGQPYVCKQPDSDMEAVLCREAMEICPVNAIGDKGPQGVTGQA